MTASASTYLLFGLKVRSALPLPELAPVSWEGAPDVVIRADRIDHPASDEGLTAVDDGMLLEIAEAGRYLVRDGSEIVVDPLPGIDPRNVRLFLLGSAFGILLHQRGLLPLHANAVEIQGRAIAFMGASGSGKSTLAAWFYDHGHAILADDVCVVDFDSSGNAQAHAGIPRLRLWLDALHRSGRTSDQLHRSYIERDRELDKFDLPIDEGRPDRTLPLAAIYLLDRGDEFAISRIRGVEAAEAVMANTYRGSYLAAVNGIEGHVQSSIALVQKVPVFRVVREWNLDQLEPQRRRLHDHALSLGAIRSIHETD
jgi:hypothetical protein